RLFCVGPPLVLHPSLAIVFAYCKFIPAGPSAVFLKSTDAGQGWSLQRFLPLERWAASVAVDPADPLTVYAGTNGDGAFKTTDGGTRWSPINTGLKIRTVNRIVLDPTDPQNIYAGTSGGVFKSTNGGEDWEGRGQEERAILTIAVDATDPNFLYVGTSRVREGGVYKSTDGGKQWFPSSVGLANYLIRGLALDPVNSQIIY